MRREERVTVQGPVKEQQPDGMSHRGENVGNSVRKGRGEGAAKQFLFCFVVYARTLCNRVPGEKQFRTI